MTHHCAFFIIAAYGILFTDGVVFRQGSYLSAIADIGVFEHSLTTDLLNHLVFVQKVFMKVSGIKYNCCGTGYKTNLECYYISV